MGLVVSVGVLADLSENDEEGAAWFRDALEQINEVLVEQGYPEHHEPEQLPEMECRDEVAGYPYLFLHYLRRFYAQASHNPDWEPTPLPEEADPTDDPLLEEQMGQLSSHLLSHSDAEGFYLPLDFTEIIVDETDQDRIVGGLLGSSYRLLEELVSIAPQLGIQLNGNTLSDEEAEKINSDTEAELEFWIEKIVWISLYEAARLSIEHRTAIVFN
ncbi:hypothetical protein SAMN05421753_102129 [Planctomicrobium piriforme]|uniref:Uncharacterized protein n=2 Tax=Planctomicrobium piriforme TaxID=1576369 RepID=A0A1I3C707_9PLAN|nr:hypothetical protein SAMN05421753_102129 [Planctomicrobium piriforme]